MRRLKGFEKRAWRERRKAMDIFVCIKQVPSTNKVQVDEKTGVLKRSGIQSKICLLYTSPSPLDSWLTLIPSCG